MCHLDREEDYLEDSNDMIAGPASDDLIEEDTWYR
jgi:hypothetical protein